MVYVFSREGLFAIDSVKKEADMKITDGEKIYGTFLLALKH